MKKKGDIVIKSERSDNQTIYQLSKSQLSAKVNSQLI